MDLLLGAPIVDENQQALGTLGGVVIDPLSRTVHAISLVLDEKLQVALSVPVDVIRGGRAVASSVSARGIVRVHVPLSLVRGVSGTQVMLGTTLEVLQSALQLHPNMDNVAGVPLVLRQRSDGGITMAAAGIPDTYVPHAELDEETVIRDVYGKTGRGYELRVNPFTHKLESLRVTAPIANSRADDRISAAMIGSIHRRFITIRIPLF